MRRECSRHVSAAIPKLPNCPEECCSPSCPVSTDEIAAAPTGKAPTSEAQLPPPGGEIPVAPAEESTAEMPPAPVPEVIPVVSAEETTSEIPPAPALGGEIVPVGLV